MPRVSVITPCYNAGRFIGETIESVLKQSFSDWEYTLVDDGSTDNSREVITSYLKNDSRLRLISQPNRGVAAARNLGFEASSKESKFLLFLDADDVLEQDMLKVFAYYL